MRHITKTIDRQYELDVFRIIAILGMMLFHYTFRGFAADNYSILSFPILGEIFIYGYLGIYLFMMISGYVMSMSTPNKGLKDFAVSRLARLYPTYWIAVTLISVITLQIGADRFHVNLIQYIANLTMLNETIGINSIDGAHWFMAIVLKFNIIIAVVLLLRLMKYQEYLAGIWLLLASILTFYHLPIVGFFVMPEFAPFFVAGIIFLSAKTQGWNLYKYIIIIFSLLFSMYSLVENINNMQQHYHHTFSAFVISSIVLLFYLAFYLITIRKKSIHLPKAFILYGSATYPLFLIHHNIGYMIFNSLGEWCNKYLLLSITVIIMILVSLVIAKYTEPYLYNKSRRALELIFSFMENKFRKIFVELITLAHGYMRQL